MFANSTTNMNVTLETLVKDEKLKVNWRASQDKTCLKLNFENTAASDL